MYLKHLRPHQLREAVERGDPLLVPAGCIETHGPHMAIGHDTIIVEEICARIAERINAVIAPPFDFGPTGYALGGPADGTIDPDYPSFGAYVKSILRNFLEMGFKSIQVIIMHQGMEAPLALTFKKAAAELSFEMVLAEGHPRGWWADGELARSAARWGQIQVHPMILPEASPPAGGDHAGYNETSFLLATRPELVDQRRLDERAPWYCRQDEEKNSWTANPGHGRLMVEAVVEAWVKRLSEERSF
jgi:creatinine amidohydrolase